MSVVQETVSAPTHTAHPQRSRVRIYLDDLFCQGFAQMLSRAIAPKPFRRYRDDKTTRMENDFGGCVGLCCLFPGACGLQRCCSGHPRYKDITVRMLINHTSGLPGTTIRNGFTTVKNRDYVKDTLEVLQTAHLVHEPGTISIYCNDGFTVAEAVIEWVSGMGFANFREQEIFSKMGLTNTSAHFREGNENIARVYAGESTVPLPLEYVNILGSGGLSSTAVDLCKFGEILQPGSLLSPEMLAEYTRAQYGHETVFIGVPEFNCGLGWDFVPAQKLSWMGVEVLAKSGGTTHYTSQLYVAPEERISVAAIFAGMADPAAVTAAVLEATLRELGILEGTAPQPEASGKAGSSSSCSTPQSVRNWLGSERRQGQSNRRSLPGKSHDAVYQYGSDCTGHGCHQAGFGR